LPGGGLEVVQEEVVGVAVDVGGHGLVSERKGEAFAFLFQGGDGDQQVGALGLEGGAAGGGAGEEGVEGGGISEAEEGLLDGVEEGGGADGVGVAGAAEGAPVGVGVAAVVVVAVGVVEFHRAAAAVAHDEAGDGGDARMATSATAGALLEDGAMGGGVPGGRVGGGGIGGDQVGAVGDEAGVAVVVEDVSD